MGRPLKKIDKKAMIEMAKVGCSYAEMAAVLGTTPELLHRRFEQQIELAYGNYKTLLRRGQWKNALKGSDRMLMHLGKHHLGQHEIQRVAVTDTEGKDLPVQRSAQEIAEGLRNLIEKLRDRPTSGTSRNGE